MNKYIIKDYFKKHFSIDTKELDNFLEYDVCVKYSESDLEKLFGIINSSAMLMAEMYAAGNDDDVWYGFDMTDSETGMMHSYDLNMYVCEEDIPGSVSLNLCLYSVDENGNTETESCTNIYCAFIKKEA